MNIAIPLLAASMFNHGNICSGIGTLEASYKCYRIREYSTGLECVNATKLVVTIRISDGIVKMNGLGFDIDTAPTSTAKEPILSDAKSIKM